MKTILGFALFCSMVSAEPVTQDERNRAMSHLHATRKMFLDSLAGVTPAQWVWKPAPDVWSIAEVAEHIAVSEQSLLELTRKILSGPAATPELLARTKGKDDAVLANATDRSKKAQAPEFLRPASRWKSSAELIAQFKKDRDITIEFIKTTQEDLRGKVLPSPALDAYQWILLIAGHSERHTMQLNEVKTKPGFPGK